MHGDVPDAKGAMNCCGKRMISNGSEFTCENCGNVQIREVYQVGKKSGPVGHPLTLCVAGRSLIVNNCFGKAAQKQKNVIIDEIRRCFPDRMFPEETLLDIQSQFNEIKTLYNHKKIIRGEILAALIYFSLNKDHLPMQRREISERLGVKGRSFPRGEAIVVEFQKEHKGDKSKILGQVNILDLSQRYLIKYNSMMM